jgi:hypothetical protein
VSLVLVVTACHDIGVRSKIKLPGASEGLYKCEHHGVGNAQQKQRWRQVREQIVLQSNEPHRMPSAAKFLGDGTRLSAMDPCQWMQPPGFANDSDVQELLVQNSGHAIQVEPGFRS